MSDHTDLLELASAIVDVAQQAGAERTDAFVRATSQVTFEVRDGELESLRHAASKGLGLRVTVEGRTTMVHTTDLRVFTLMNLAKKAIAMARTLPEPEEPTRYAKPQEVLPLTHPDLLLADESREEKIARAVAVERALLGVPGVTVATGVSYTEREGTEVLVNAEGVQLQAPVCHIEMGAEGIAERDGESATGTRYTHVPARKYLLPPEEVGRSAGERAVELLGARPLPSTKAPVIFDPLTAYAVLRSLVPALRGDNVVHDRSFFGGRLGEKIAADSITIRDNAWLSRGAGRRSFDGEGTPSQNLAVIENGVLKTYLLDLSSAGKLGLAPTGSALRESYTSQPDIGTGNFYMESGAHTREEIIQNTKRGLLVTNLSGWWVGLSPVTDTFSSAAMGLWIEDGEIAYPVRNISIGGNLREMLTSIDMIGDDLSHYHLTCSPTFRVAEMAISGV